MFTGLVEIIGTVSILDASSDGTTLTISDCAEILNDAALGDSISVNGTCLTVTKFDKSSFKVGVAPETLRRTNLGSLKTGSKVNLERAVSASTRMGGHFVQGHVDTTASIAKITPDGEALTFRFTPRSKEVMRQIVEKGYITLDGASLTITAVNDAESWFEVMLIAYTQTRVVTAAKRVGDEVNVEVDISGKYVEKAVLGYFQDLEFSDGGSASAGARPAVLEKMVNRMVEEKLRTMRLNEGAR